ncbi:hypothetical protein HAX54_049220 [Datura stramonium]|uniref:Uncharacterized protein n=1 Tax=Datura stramonium TaxID=4076 RepID=A0ABS8RQP3_DATST|nr:hypothetical protein [Datura stramonium]
MAPPLPHMAMEQWHHLLSHHPNTTYKNNPTLSGQTPKSYLHHSAGSPVVGLSVEPAKKKRGQPRKTAVAQIPSMVNSANPGVGGINAAASSENPFKKDCERTLGSEK